MGVSLVLETRRVSYLKKMQPSFSFLMDSISAERMELLRRLQKNIGIDFAHVGILECSLVHPSCRGTDESLPARCTNETLEFLGDAVLSMVVTEFLFYEDPNYEEGLLSRIRSKVISGVPLAEIASSIGLQEYLRVQSPSLLQNKSVLENALESLIGGIYLDQGYSASKDFILQHLETIISRSILERDVLDEKSLLQEMVQKEYFKHPEYIFENEETRKDGDDFIMSVRLNGEILAQANAKSKKEAMILCARKALKKCFGVDR